MREEGLYLAFSRGAGWLLRSYVRRSKGLRNLTCFRIAFEINKKGRSRFNENGSCVVWLLPLPSNLGLEVKPLRKTFRIDKKGRSRFKRERPSCCALRGEATAFLPLAFLKLRIEQRRRMTPLLLRVPMPTHSLCVIHRHRRGYELWCRWSTDSAWTQTHVHCRHTGTGIACARSCPCHHYCVVARQNNAYRLRCCVGTNATCGPAPQIRDRASTRRNICRQGQNVVD